MRLLVIEDDRALAAALRDGLTAQGFAVDVGTRVSEARQALSLASYDGMVLDLGLPDEDGLPFLREMRQRNDIMPVLVLTARGDVSDRVAGLNAGADDYVQKPFAFPELIARVRALLRRGGQAIPPVLRVGDLELDAGRFRATRGDVPIPLTPKEFAILEYFMRHAGQLVTRTMLLDQCWDASYEGVSNLVDVHVGRVRRKLDAAGSAPLLHTIRGAGFVLDEQPR
jgi:two-component system OmpR family response regulator